MPGKTRRGAALKTAVAESISPPTEAPSTGGWGAVAKRKAVSDTTQSSGGDIYDFFMKDGDTVQIQFLSAEPYCSDFYRVQVGKRWKYLNTQLANSKHCLLEQSGVQSTWRAAFKVLDYRGKWDKEKKCTESDMGIAYDEVTPQEKLWLVSNTVALGLKSFIDRKGGDLKSIIIEVTRTGADKTTTYAFEVARDEDDNKLKTLEFDQKHPSAEECCEPPTDEMLVDWGVINDHETDASVTL